MSTINLTQRQTKILEALGSESAIELLPFVLRNHGVSTILEWLEFSMQNGTLEHGNILYDCSVAEIVLAIRNKYTK